MPGRSRKAITSDAQLSPAAPAEQETLEDLLNQLQDLDTRVLNAIEMDKRQYVRVYAYKEDDYDEAMLGYDHSLILKDFYCEGIKIEEIVKLSKLTVGGIHMKMTGTYSDVPKEIIVRVM